ncbi:phosphatidylglycerophosphatase A [Candidatus Dependentiae bacterium]|nr:phosphatidylglycerophosphatase A [Candidatus Dependentiae bacterium]MCC7414912.1 phosphatidylglycerophosphatase A [Campylobacterota bacterium]
MRTLSLQIAMLAGLGRVAYAPGTCASAITALLILFLSSIGMWSWLSSIMILFAALVAAWAAIVVALPLFGGDEDPSAIVIDELVGMCTTFAGVAISWHTLLIGFLLFRFFDICKPLGIRRLERMRGAVGILADDVAAGLCANVLMHAFMWFLA